MENIKHYIVWNTWIGRKYRDAITWVGLWMLRKGRRLLKRSVGRCSWCGSNCGFSSTVSGKGLRCQSLDRDCTEMPDV